MTKIRKLAFQVLALFSLSLELYSKSTRAKLTCLFHEPHYALNFLRAGTPVFLPSVSPLGRRERGKASGQKQLLNYRLENEKETQRSLLRAESPHPRPLRYGVQLNLKAPTAARASGAGGMCPAVGRRGASALQQDSSQIWIARVPNTTSLCSSLQGGWRKNRDYYEHKLFLRRHGQDLYWITKVLPGVWHPFLCDKDCVHKTTVCITQCCIHRA